MDKKKSKKELFVEMYNSHSDAIFRYCLFRISDRERALDLTQEIFMKIWNYLQTAEKEILNMRAFLYKTAGNIIVDEYRKRKLNDSLETLYEETGFEPSVLLSQSLIDSIDGKGAIELVKELGEPYSSVVFMRFVEELSLGEISEVTGQSENTVAVQVHRGIAKLQKLFNHDPVRNDGNKQK